MKFVLYAAALVAAVIDTHAATAATLSEIYGFAGGPDWLYPASIQVNAKAIFGTTLRGGTAGLGTVFRIDRATGTKTTLHSFGGGADGSNPSGAVVLSSGFL